MRLRGPKLAPVVLAGVMSACSSSEILVVDIPDADLADAKSVVVILQDLDGIEHVGAADRSDPGPALPPERPSYEGEPLTLTIFAFSQSLEALRLAKGPVQRTANTGTLQKLLDFPTPTKVLSVDLADGSSSDPVELAAQDLSPRLRQLEIEISTGVCDAPNTNLLFAGDLTQPTAFVDAQIGRSGVAVLVGDVGRVGVDLRAAIATLDVSRIDPKRPSVVNPAVTILDPPFESLRVLVGDPDVALFGYAVSSTTARGYFFETGPLGRDPEMWPSPFEDEVAESGARVSSVQLKRRGPDAILAFDRSRVFELKPSDRSIHERTNEFPLPLADYAFDEEREYAMTVVTRDHPGAAPSFHDPALWVRERGGEWREELRPPSPVSETDHKPVLSVSAGPSGAIATASTWIYLRQPDGRWEPDELESATIGKMDTIQLKKGRLGVLGFAGFIGIHDAARGWCRVPASGSSRSINFGVTDSSSRYILVLDEANVGRTIPTWLALLSMGD
ncbi:MAG: hypothetical protein HYV07_00710 [Deltaproteobacteria bacterium]|nr:hypothetical protein [Deltaproteobacteria bacterium]